MTDEELALAERVIRAAVRRHRLSAAHADDFTGFVRLRLIEGRTFEKFQHRSSLRTFLTTVVERLYLDFRNQEWGKWRPSVEARRLGDLAVRLEMLLTREGLRFEEAYETLLTAHQITETRDELYAMSLRFPRRNPRRVVGEEALNDHPDPGTPDLCVLETELHSVAGRLAAALVSRALTAGSLAGPHLGRLDAYSHRPFRSLAPLRAAH